MPYLIEMGFLLRHQDIESPLCLKEAQQVPDAISGNDKGILVKSPEKDIIESATKPLRVCKRYTHTHLTLPTTPLSFSRVALFQSFNLLSTSKKKGRCEEKQREENYDKEEDQEEGEDNNCNTMQET